MQKLLAKCRDLRCHLVFLLTEANGRAGRDSHSGGSDSSEAWKVGRVQLGLLSGSGRTQHVVGRGYDVIHVLASTWPRGVLQCCSVVRVVVVL